MKTIHKYELELEEFQRIQARPGPIRNVGLDPAGGICVWVEVDTEDNLHWRKFIIVGTGHEIPKGYILEFAGTVVQGSFVWHIYEDWSGK